MPSFGQDPSREFSIGISSAPLKGICRVQENAGGASGGPLVCYKCGGPIQPKLQSWIPHAAIPRRKWKSAPSKIDIGWTLMQSSALPLPQEAINNVSRDETLALLFTCTAGSLRMRRKHSIGC